MSLWQRTDVAGKLPKYLPVGQLLIINVTDGGTGYDDGAAVAVTIGAPDAGGVQATATAVVTDGIVQSITLTNPGSLYTSDPAVSLATGSGLTVSIVKAANIYDPTKIVFVDRTEAAVASNKSRGINSPGWWYVNEYIDGSGNPRYKTEQLITISSSGSVQGDAGDSSDDSLVPDVTMTVAISVQPTNQTSVGGAATFSVTAAATPSGTVTYQWQSKAPTAQRFSNIGGATSSSYNKTGAVVGDSGTLYRVVVGSDSGAKKITSDEVSLTFGS